MFPVCKVFDIIHVGNLSQVLYNINSVKKYCSVWSTAKWSNFGIPYRKTNWCSQITALSYVCMSNSCLFSMVFIIFLGLMPFKSSTKSRTHFINYISNAVLHSVIESRPMFTPLKLVTNSDHSRNRCGGFVCSCLYLYHH